MKLRSSLFAKIILWFFVNLALVSMGFMGFFLLQSRTDLLRFLKMQTSGQMRMAGKLISHDLREAPRAEWPGILKSYEKTYHVNFVLLLGFEEKVLVGEINIPDTVMKKLRENFRRGPAPGPPPPPIPPAPDRRLFPPDMDIGHDFSEHEPPGESHLIMRTKNPTQYWARIPMPPLHQPAGPPVQAVLLAVSDSMTGNGFFFDPNPVIIAAASVILISVLFWIPLVRSITRPLGRMTLATEEIAKGKFDVSIQLSRTDEIGRLANAINHMTARLSGFVKGQKRFLGDIAHELGSPLARIQLGLGILEQNMDGGNQRRVADVIDDVDHLSNLVNELLSFSRAEMSPARVGLQTTELLPIVTQAVQRETTSKTKVVIQVDPDLTAVVDPELLTRALANLVRNAVKYAGDSGPIHISAQREKSEVTIEVRDAGPGVPEDLLGQIFDPFFRPATARDRNSGGVGLGLAIVKTCVETCNGSVSAQNLKPKGFGVKITLPG